MNIRHYLIASRIPQHYTPNNALQGISMRRWITKTRCIALLLFSLTNLPPEHCRRRRSRSRNVIVLLLLERRSSFSYRSGMNAQEKSSTEKTTYKVFSVHHHIPLLFASQRKCSSLHLPPFLCIVDCYRSTFCFFVYFFL